MISLLDLGRKAATTQAREILLRVADRVGVQRSATNCPAAH
jgi:hypothetical protein